MASMCNETTMTQMNVMHSPAALGINASQLDNIEETLYQVNDSSEMRWEENEIDYGSGARRMIYDNTLICILDENLVKSEIWMAAGNHDEPDVDANHIMLVSAIENSALEPGDGHDDSKYDLCSMDSNMLNDILISCLLLGNFWENSRKTFGRSLDGFRATVGRLLDYFWATY